MRLRNLLAAVIVVPVCAGLAFQSISMWCDDRRFPPPGKLYEVGGYRLHLFCEGTGSPAVILDAGLGDSSLTWSLVRSDIARITRVCVVDRAGYGWSDQGPAPRDSAQIAKELDALLVQANVPAPYLMAGHSMGGYNVRVYRAAHPDKVAAMLLVDSAHEDQARRFAHILGAGAAPSAFDHFKSQLSMRVGLPRILHQCGWTNSFRPAALIPFLPVMEARDCRSSPWDTADAELAALPETAKEVANSGSLGVLPLIVLSQQPGLRSPDNPRANQETDALWEQMQKELTALSTNGRRIVAQGSGHYIQIQRPDLVIAAIRELVAR
jgi:pimeloyl-ACP methyl ester carboxylesterase